MRSRELFFSHDHVCVRVRRPVRMQGAPHAHVPDHRQASADGHAADEHVRLASIRSWHGRLQLAHERVLIADLHRRFRPQRPERAFQRGSAAAEGASPRARRWVVPELVQERNLVLLAPRSAAVSASDRHRQPSPATQHAIHP